MESTPKGSRGSALREYLAKRAAQVDEALAACLKPVPTGAGLLYEAMGYSLLAGGKRIRPSLCLASAELVGGRPEWVMPTACALEMIHTYSLIHDDLPVMDNDDFRRGRPTNHTVYGEAMAILAGDGLLTLAFDLIARNADVPQVGADRTLRVVAEVSAAAGPRGMVAGQVSDMEWEGKQAGAETLEAIHRLKTGAMFRCSLRSGAILCGADQRTLVALDEYASEIGLAFQIQDDILDLTGDERKLGKKPGSDLKHDKSTYPKIYGLERSREMAGTATNRAIASLAHFGEQAWILRDLARYIISREL